MNKNLKKVISAAAALTICSKNRNLSGNTAPSRHKSARSEEGQPAFLLGSKDHAL